MKAAFSFDGGATFGTPVRIDDGEPLGRVDVEWPAGGAAIVSWLERAGAGAEIRVRQVRPEGTLGGSRTVAEISAARASGFPRMTRIAGAVIIAWTETGESGGIKVAELGMPR